jgi:hypothetical protein
MRVRLQAERYLNHVRTTVDPVGDAFRSFVDLMASMNSPADDEVAYGLRLYGARPKCV